MENKNDFFAKGEEEQLKEMDEVLKQLEAKKEAEKKMTHGQKMKEKQEAAHWRKMRKKGK